NLGAVQTLGNLLVDTAAGGVTFGGADTASIGANGPVTTIHTEGQIDIGTGTTAADVIGGTGITFNGGAGPLTVTTTNSPVRLNGAVTLDTNLKIDTGAGPGDITFTAANVIGGAGTGRIDSQAGEHNDLVLSAGTGSVFFSGNLGAVQTLGNLLVDTAAGGVTFGGADTASIGASAPVTTIHTEDQIDLGTGTTAAHVIGGTGITFNGGAGPLTVTTTNSPVRLNGAVTLDTNLQIDTGAGPGDI